MHIKPLSLAAAIHFCPGLALYLALLIFPVGLYSQDSVVKGFPKMVREIQYTSSADGSQQPALFYRAPSDDNKKRPLLVALHTWSGNYRQSSGGPYARWCLQQGWNFIHPNFRGPNWTPEAMGSDLVVADILSAVEHARKNALVDEDRIYCIGVSGGGHASMLMAGRAPDLWAGVSAWVGIYDIAQWHKETREAGRKYYEHVEKALGGDPWTDPARRKDANHRSPMNWLEKAKGVNLDINHGITDGRTGSVPFSHSLHAFNRVLPENAPEKIPVKAIDKAWETGTAEPLPGSISLDDDLYGKRQPLYRKVHGNTRVTIFQGGHEIIHLAALNWLAQQRKGEPARWKVKKIADLNTSDKEAESGK